uniref:Uncharacterized protein n=1 Tax=Entomoneis paludosa TaxID=265537 RepID=A0A7S3DZ02_9STRA
MGSSSSKASEAVEPTTASAPAPAQDAPTAQYVLQPTTTVSSIPSPSTSQTQQPQQQRHNERLQHGPCAEPYEWLQKCQTKRNIPPEKTNLLMHVCVSEMDLLMTCIKKHPLYFHADKAKQQEQKKK